ncbi:AraC family transcriptional regulator [Micropruina sp.]|uniref:helix-turn-helix transcriptional regulator n=1 Tax=Micropruina sp. TaxID=2737536 RepID=UPI0026393742|nr:AraC family transcriptional regulator [Micropruina sp.]
MKIDEVLVAWKARSDELMSGPEAAPRLAHLRDGDGRARRTLLADYFLRPDERIGVLFHTMTPIPDEPITLHNHDFFEVAYLHSGMATHHHASGQMTMLPGDLVFLNPHVRHEVRIHDGACLINLIIRPEIMQQTSAFSLADAPLFAEYVVTYFHLMQRRQDFIHVSRQATGAAQIRGLVESIAIECFRRQPAWESVCVGYFTALFATLSREQAAQVGENDAPRLVTSILKHLEAHRAEATLELVASAFGYSPSHISRLIRRHTGKGFGQITTELRLEQAQEYLERTTLPIQTVAKRSGFASASYLTRVFKQRHGIPPGRYRALHHRAEN